MDSSGRRWAGQARPRLCHLVLPVPYKRAVAYIPAGHPCSQLCSQADGRLRTAMVDGRTNDAQGRPTARTSTVAGGRAGPTLHGWGSPEQMNAARANAGSIAGHARRKRRCRVSVRGRPLAIRRLCRILTCPDFQPATKIEAATQKGPPRSKPAQYQG